jgi:uncharacterized membrane protein YgcG
MSNLALNKLPLEKWGNAEIATNGDILNYDSHNGFAQSSWPCDYTMDLGEIHLIQNIRFLLWDNLGAKSTPNAKPNSRRYNFSLSVSGDNKTYFTIFSNKDKEGGNGWYSFNFLKDLHARYVKLTGHFNSANEKIHLVEFEVHDEKPSKLESKNVHEFEIITDIPSEQKISELINRAISEKSDVFKGVIEQKARLDQVIEDTSGIIDTISLIKTTHDYETEANRNKRNEVWWIIVSITIIVVFFLVLKWFWIVGSEISIIEKASQNPKIEQFTSILLGAFFVNKAVIISTILFIFSWALKNYRATKHNYVINKHKAMTLAIATSILNQKKYENAKREEVFNKAMAVIFSHQPTGFTKGDDKDSSVTDSVVKQIIRSHIE